MEVTSMRSIFSTTPTYWQLPLRLCLFTVFWMHGSQKVLGMYGGPGLSGFVGWLTSTGVPAPLAYLAAAAEFLGCFGILFGFLTRIAAFGIACNMAVALLTVHLKNGYFGGPQGPGYELVFILLCAAITLLIGGAGNLSVDRAIYLKRRTSP
jgi:putative oxidoreductase